MVLCCLLFNLDADPTNCVFVLTRGHLTSASEAAGISDYVKVIAQAGLMYEQVGGGRHCPGGSPSRTSRTLSGLWRRPTGGRISPASGAATTASMWRRVSRGAVLQGVRTQYIYGIQSPAHIWFGHLSGLA